eukprot:3921647-Pyramimonas_sp.AAC.1
MDGSAPPIYGRFTFAKRFVLKIPSVTFRGPHIPPQKRVGTLKTPFGFRRSSSRFPAGPFGLRYVAIGFKDY